MKMLSILTLCLFATCIAIPLASSVWWNPFTWFSSEPAPVGIENGSIFIQSTGEQWTITHASGQEAQLKLWLADAKDKKTEIGFIPPNNDCSGWTDKLLYDRTGAILDDKNKQITLKCESAKCDGQNCYHISLTDAQAVNIDDYVKLGENSLALTYQDQNLINYQLDFADVNISLTDTTLPASVNDIWITQNPNNYKFGANHTGMNETELHNFTYTIKSTEQLYSNGLSPYLLDPSSIQGQLSELEVHHEFDFRDICTRNFIPMQDLETGENYYKYSADCKFDYWSGSGFYYLNVSFLSDRNIDPSITNITKSTIASGVKCESDDFCHLSISDKNLTHYYPFENNGTRDWSNVGHTGTLQNGAVVIADGYVGSALRTGAVGAINDNMYASTTGMLVANGTVCAWVKPLGKHGDSSFGFVFFHRTGSNNNRLYIYANEGAGDQWHFGFSTDATEPTSATFVDGVWDNLCISWAGGTYWAYENGIQIDADTSNGALSGVDANFYLGSNSGSSEGFNGTIDEFQIWNATLTPTQIGQVYNQSYPRFFQTGNHKITTIINPCYQESANVSTACGGLDTGVYTSTGGWSNLFQTYDGDWDTWGQATNFQTSYIYINYTKPTGSLNTPLWQVKDPDLTTNLSISQVCWDYDMDVLVLRALSKHSDTPSQIKTTWDCYSGTWDIIRTTSTGSGKNLVYEEAMIWAMPSGDNRVNISLNISADQFYSSISNLSVSVWDGDSWEGEVNMTNGVNQTFTIDSSATMLNLSIDYQSNASRFWSPILFPPIKYSDTWTSGGEPEDNPPVTTITIPATNNTNTSITNYNINFTRTDDNGIDTCWWANDSMTRNMTIGSGLNVTNVTWAEGLHSIRITCNDTINQVGIDTVTFRLDTTPPNITLITETPADPNEYNPSAVYEFNISVLDYGVGGIGTAILQFNGINYTAENRAGNIWNVTLTPLGAGTWNYHWFVNDTIGNKNGTEGGAYTVSVNSSAVLTLTGTTPITYGTTGDVEGSTCPSEQACALYRNDTAGTVSNPDTSVLGAKYYNYTYNTTANQNYTSNNISYVIQVQQATSVLNGTINGTQGNFTVVNGTGSQNIMINSSLASPCIGSGNITINGTIGAIGTIPLTNISDLRPSGVPYNVTFWYAGNQNCTSDKEIWWVNVSYIKDTTFPLITYIPPTPDNNSIISSQSIIDTTFFQNVSITEDTQINNVTFCTLNLTSACPSCGCTVYAYEENLTQVAVTDGNYTINATACDTSNNCNYTGNYYFTMDDTTPTINIAFPTNKSTHTQQRLDVNYTASDFHRDSCWYSNDTMTKNISLTTACLNITDVTWALGKHNVTIWVNDSAGNFARTTVLFNITITETDPPTVTDLTETPIDNVEFDDFERNYQFNATIADTTGIADVIFQFHNTNYTASNHAGNVWNVTITTTLGAGTWNYHWFANDTNGYANGTEEGTYIINQRNTETEYFGVLNGTIGNLTVIAIGTANLGFGSAFNYDEEDIKCGGEGNITLDGVEFVAGTIPIIEFDDFSVGFYNVTFIYYGNQNCSYDSDTWWLNVTEGDNTPPTVTNLADNDGEFAPNRKWQINATVTDANALSNVTLQFNGVNYTASQYGGAGDIYNITISNLEVGVYNYLWFANDSYSNYNNTEEGTLTITQNSSYVLSLTGTTPITYETVGDVEGTTCPAQLSCGLYRNDTGLGVSNPDTTVLGVRFYNYTYNTTGNTNYTANNKSFILEVQQATANTNISFNVSSPITYGTYLNVTCTNVTGGSPAVLFRDNVNIDATENGLSTLLGAGTYTYECNMTESQNYTAIQNSSSFTVNQFTSVVATWLNGTQANLSINNGTKVHLNGTLTAGAGDIELWIDGVLNSTGSSPRNAYYNFTTIKLYNITTIRRADQNYTFSAETWWVNVSSTFVPADTDAPVFTNLINHTHTANTSFSYDVDATDATGVAKFWLNDTTRFSINNNTGVITNHTSLDIPALHWLKIYVNDTLSNERNSVFWINITEIPVVTFSHGKLILVLMTPDMDGSYNYGDGKLEIELMTPDFKDTYNKQVVQTT